MREQTIINALQTNGPMSAAALAATLGVSRRTLQSDLRQLNEDNTGFIITVTRNVGYQLTITDSAQFAAYQASLEDQAQPPCRRNDCLP
ncbi:BglG family transcription antiterminator [Lacticaseibacillus paracasei]|nr:BglG family transcription antiterminator [Lacticaseibacillus paracasei]